MTDHLLLRSGFPNSDGISSSRDKSRKMEARIGGTVICPNAARLLRVR
jgi:hypothetical protein